MRYCRLCGKELIDKQIYYCSICKKKKQVEWTMKCKKKRIPTTEIGVGKGNSSKNKQRALGIGTYTRVKKAQCELCSSTRYLVVHHIDKNRYNNDPSNLQTLCRKCHTIQHSQHLTRNSKGQFTRAK